MSKKLEHAVLYIRSDSYSNGSLDTQKAKVKDYIKKHSLKLSIIEESHDGGNAPLEDRSGLSRLMRLVEGGIIQTVIVGSYYRISRNNAELYNIKSQLETHGVKLIVLESLDGGGLSG